MRLTGHPAVGTKRQLRPNNSLPHHLANTGTDQLGTIHTIFGRNWTVEQDTQDRSTNREGMPQHATMATYSDVKNLAMPKPKTANGLLRSYVAVWPNIEAPHTRFASPMK